MLLVQILLFCGFALLGRWIQLHPERVFPKGTFVAANSAGAKLGRAQIAVIGTFAVFAGTAGTLSTLLLAIPIHSPAAQAVAWTISFAGGLIAAFYVRKETHALPTFK